MSRARLVDVAVRAGVSSATASLVLRDRPGPSEATRAAVRAAAEMLEYRVDRSASALARQRTGLLGVVLDIQSTFHAELVDALDTAAVDGGWDLVLATLTRRTREEDAVRSLVDSRCEGLVLLGSDLPAARLRALAAQVATVVLGRPGSAEYRGVRADDATGMRLAVDHLLALGHRRIAHVDGGRGPVATARRRGFGAAVLTHGLPSWTVPGGIDEVSGLEAVERLLEGGPPTAVVAYNDRAAVGVREGLLRAGLDVPGVVSVVGYDDSPLARMTILGLTSVSQQPSLLAVAAVRAVGALTGQADVDSTPVTTVVPPRLVVRSSTASAPGRG